MYGRMEIPARIINHKVNAAKLTVPVSPIGCFSDATQGSHFNSWLDLHWHTFPLDATQRSQQKEQICCLGGSTATSLLMQGHYFTAALRTLKTPQPFASMQEIS